MGDCIGRLILVGVLTAVPAYGQVVGASLTGTVRDATGTPIPGATVTVKNAETGAARKLVSDDSGRYAAPSITIGPYQVIAEKQGFTTQVKTGIRLAVGQSAVVDLTLAVGELQQVVNVQESAAPVSLSTQQTSGLVNERQVKELPLNGRSYDELITLNPAIVNYTGQRAGGIGTSNSAVGNMFAVSGRRPQENLFLLNGIEYTGNSEINLTPGGASGQLLGVDAVREFNVVTDAYGAEYGKRPGAQISIITASGSNELHGSIYEFIRNNALDARNFFDQASAPQFQRNEFGGAVGGPIKKDKSFLFGNYEGFRQHLGLSNVTLVPDNNARQGIIGGVNVGIAPGVAPLLNLWPVANGPNLGGGIAESFNNPLQTIREDFGTARFDHTFSDKDTLFAVYTVDDSADTTPTINPLSNVVESLREQVVSVQEQHVFSPTLLNTARVGFSRAGYFFTGQTPVSIPGWVGSNPIGAIVIGGSTASNGASQISQAGTNVGANLNTARNLFTYDDHVGITHGIHQIEAGVWIQRIQANDNLAQYQWGQASFGSLTAFLQGTVSTFTVIPAPTALAWRSVEGAGFVQDAMKLRPNLTLRIGFRFESTNGWNEAHGRASNYLFDANGVIETSPHIGSSALSVNRAKFLPEPRAGLAWDPFGKGKTVIHAGFGIYRALLDNIDYRLDANAPFNTTQSIKNIQLGGLHITPGSALPAGSLISPSGIQPDPHTPTAITYTFQVEQQIAASTSLTLGYVGSHGYHEVLSVDANEPYPTPGTLTYPKGAPLANPNLANTTTWFTNGVSSYNAFEVDVNRRLSHGLQFRGVYTFSKSLDDGSAWNTNVGVNAPGFVMYPANPKLDYGLSTYDVRHLAVINATYEIPFGAHSRLGGWSISGIESLQSGFPFTPQLGYNPS
ncbi:MAG: Oar protein, partial [Bryobacterales bacterium]|nr:Oar protein [Bryobacterales bacterium]